MNITTISNPLAGHLLTILRDENTNSAKFRQTMESLSLVIFVEASNDIETEIIDIKTPLESTIGARLPKNIILIPILRAALAMLPKIIEMYPDAVVQHLGIYRDEKTLEPKLYYSRLDLRIKDSIVFLLDPMLATGGTLSYAVEKVAEYQPAFIRILSVVAAPEGIEKLSKTVDSSNIHTELWVSAIDRTLNENGYILPGLGDAGDRAFGTI